MSFANVVSNGTVNYHNASAHCGSWIVLYSGKGEQNSTVELAFTGTTITVNTLLWSTVPGYPATVWLDGTFRTKMSSDSTNSTDNPANFDNACTVSTLTLGDLEDQEHTISIRNNGSPLVLQSFVYIPTIPILSSKGLLVGGIVGGIVGGGVLIFLLFNICLRRHRARHGRISRHEIDVEDTESQYENKSDVVPSPTPVSPSFPNLPDAAPVVHGFRSTNQVVNHSSEITRPEALRPLPPTPAFVPLPVLAVPAMAGASLATTGGSTRSSQSEILQRLLDQGLPTAELAAAIRMLSPPSEIGLASRSMDAGGSILGPPLHNIDENAPPSYDFKEHRT
ncbi:hypothetical protein FRB94_013278 [Tulasnella sp. JGI-2019a]|nr:hypothetical protein FRB93_001983 [Tulasnella sp. JGI-2019a]KAG9008454.1 hypothetical protein FRB94_013278 [Tulasnella sp. JGI-2019a]